ncbi:Uncharacterised protein [Legionella pneumophila]|nr:Uncharacterised protein [Legionella pneumophila]
MSGVKPYLSSEIQVKLHFQRMGQLNNPPPLVIQPQNVRLDFIQYCLSQGRNLQSPQTTLDNYLKQDKNSMPESEGSREPLLQGDINRKKLSLLFSHLSAFNYNMEGLTIEPVAVADMIKKMQDINQMNDQEVAEYLDKLIGEKIPGHDSMSIDNFLDNIHDLYKNDGVSFHCYLRENFFNPLKADAIKKAEPALNYFMPDLFCQKHINTCELVTTMTILKKVVTNFNQMQNLCLDSNNLPIEVIEAQKKIKELEQKFENHLKNPSALKEGDIKKLVLDYQKEVEKIQIEMEKSLGKKFNPEITPYLKKYDNHTLSTIHHLVTTRIMPEGFDVDEWALKNTLQAKCTSFQNKLLSDHLPMIIEKDIVKNLHKDTANPEEKKTFLDSLKQMFLYGKSRAFTDFIVCGHALVMDICNNGLLKVLEHRNARKETTVLSHHGLKDLGIQSVHDKHSNPAKEALNSIEQKLKILYMERDNLVKIKAGTQDDSLVHSEISSMLVKKDNEIRDLLEVEKNLKIKYSPEKPKVAHGCFHRIKEEFQKIKAEFIGENKARAKQEALENDRNEINIIDKRPT